MKNHYLNEKGFIELLSTAVEAGLSDGPALTAILLEPVPKDEHYSDKFPILRDMDMEQAFNAAIIAFVATRKLAEVLLTQASNKPKTIEWSVSKHIKANTRLTLCDAIFVMYHDIAILAKDIERIINPFSPIVGSYYVHY